MKWTGMGCRRKGKPHWGMVDVSVMIIVDKDAKRLARGISSAFGKGNKAAASVVKTTNTLGRSITQCI